MSDRGDPPEEAARDVPEADRDGGTLRVERREAPAAGIGAALGALQHGLSHMGPGGAARALLRLNQDGGIDCPGCAWPDPEHRSHLEFCENGVKHLSHEATRRRVDREFFAKWSIPELARRSDRWLEEQGRLVEPMLRRAGRQHYEPVAWDEAFSLLGRALRELGSPDEAVFYTSGRTSNEAAFLYQLFVREFGTNNLPDCSNMCHESSGTGLGETIGVGKGTVSLQDFEEADLILLWGQNPGSNHPRMLTVLEAAKRRGCRIVAVNPLKERGLVRFAHPKDPLALLGRSTTIADVFLQVRVGGDVALLKGLMKDLLARERRSPGRIFDWEFLRSKTEGLEEWEAALDGVSWDAIVEQSGIEQSVISEAAGLYARSKRVIACWAMGLTQHVHAVANVQEIVNLLLLRGNIGRPGAGPCPVRGHSNVQGDRTMGIWERPPAAFLDALEREFGFAPPREHGLDTVGAIDAMLEDRVRVFFALGGNFAVAAPDRENAERALARCSWTVQVSTVLNRSHLVCGEQALILPCLARSERDVRAGAPQVVTVENSMSVVHVSQGRLPPAADTLRSEPAIVAGLARATLGADSRVPWEELADDYDRIRDRIARVVPGCADMNRRAREPGGFVLPSGARRREFETPSGRARFSTHPLPRIDLEPGELLLMTIRSHDQFNTTIYGDDDRYRGIYGSRRVVLVHPEDLAERGLAEPQAVDVTSRVGDETRTLRGFRVVGYDIPRGCVAAYFPEANGLVPKGHHARGSRTPAYKSVPVTLAPAV